MVCIDIHCGMYCGMYWHLLVCIVFGIYCKYLYVFEHTDTSCASIGTYLHVFVYIVHLVCVVCTDRQRGALVCVVCTVLNSYVKRQS